MNESINLAIIGLQEGLSALHAAHRSKQWNVTTLCDLNSQLLEERKEAYKLNADLVTSIDDVLNNPDVDVVAIFTPDHLHAEHAVASLEAGKHVILTKPIASSIEDAEKIQKTCLKYPDQLFFAAHTSRFIPSLMDQYADFQAGKLGKFISVEASYNDDKRSRMLHLADKWGRFSPLYIWLIHPMDIALWYLGDVKELSLISHASSSIINTGNAYPDNYLVNLNNQSGQLGLVKGYYSVPEPSIVECVLRGENGYSVATYPEMRYHAVFDVHENLDREYASSIDHYFPFGRYSHHVGEMGNILTEAANCIKNTVKPSVGIEEGFKTVETLQRLEALLY